MYDGYVVGSDSRHDLRFLSTVINLTMLSKLKGMKARSRPETYRQYDPAPVYAPLVDGQIRVLTLMLYDPAQLQQISCRITAQYLYNQPSYNAISYTWGSELRDHYITWSARKLWVTKSCFRACQQMLKFERLDRESDVVIWIDQLSIDQANDSERSRQIELMGQIYWNANAVTVFLGDPDSSVLSHHSGHLESSSKYLSMIETLQRAQHALQKSSFSGIAEITSRDKPSLGDYRLFQGLVLCSILTASATTAARAAFTSTKAWAESLPRNLQDLLTQQEAWLGFEAIFCRINRRTNFFRRRWILQETRRLSSMCYISRFRIPIFTLVSALRIGLDYVGSAGFFPGLIKLTLPDLAMRLQFEAEQASAMLTIQQHEGGLDLLWLLDHCRAAECSNPRDMFYAVRSLVSANAVQLPLPGYYLDESMVVREHLIYLLKCGHGAALVQKSGFQQGGLALPGTPSWCPPWLFFNKLEGPTLLFHDLKEWNGPSFTLSNTTQRRLVFGRLQQDRRKHLSSGAARETNLTWRDDAAALVVQGTLIGQVRCTSASTRLVELVAAHHLKITDTAATFARQCTMLPTLSAERERLLFRQVDDPCTYIQLQFYLGRHYVDDTSSRLPNTLQLKMLLHERSLCHIDIDSTLIPAFSRAPDSHADGLTKELSVLGLGSHWAQQGDLLVVFDGFETPTMIRTYRKPGIHYKSAEFTGGQELTYKVIGDAHVMQLADGELLEQANVKSRRFVLV